MSLEMLKEAKKPGGFPVGLSSFFNILIFLSPRQECTLWLSWIDFNKEEKFKQSSFDFNASYIYGHLAIDHISPIECDLGNTAGTIPKIPIELVILRWTF